MYIPDDGGGLQRKVGRMLKKSVSVVLSRPSPCNVPQGYASVAELPAALLNGLFEHPQAVLAPALF